MGESMAIGKARTWLIGVVAALLAGLLLVVALGGNEAEAATGELVAQGALVPQAGSTVDTATPVSLNQGVTGMISQWGGEDWYKVTLTKAGKFQIKFRGTYKSNGYWEVSLRDRNNKELQNTDRNAEDCVSGGAVTTHTIGLPAGTYYIRVRGWSVDGLPYTMTPAFSASSAWEREWNDNVGQANSRALGKAVSGAANGWGDEDWYKVKLTKAGRFQIKFKGKYQNDGYWRVSLSDQNNQEMWSADRNARDCVSGNTVTMHTTGLPAGTYYICVMGRNVNNLVYTMTPAFSASSAWEREWNDNVGQANSRTLGATVSGTSKGWGDEDWYKVSVPKTGKFQVKFNGQYRSDGNWTVTLYNRDAQVILGVDYYATTRSTKTLMMQSLKAGTYYIRVKGWNVDNLVYAMTPGYYVQTPSSFKAVAAKKAFTAKWKRVSGAVNYQVRYSLKSTMKSAKTINVSKNASAKKITKLQAKKKYYVQVRTVKKIAGKKYYSSWSVKRAVTTKK